MPSRFDFDLLQPDDLDAALTLSAGEGWNQTAPDWARLVSLEPAGCFAARHASRLLGTVTTTIYGRELAWIGMMIVHPDVRRQGVGEALMRLAMDHVERRGIPVIKLDATPAGRPLYESLGFRAEAEFERWQGIAAVRGGTESSRPIAAARDQLRALDHAAHGADRSLLLDLLVRDGAGEPLVVAGQGVPLGYALARAGRAASYVGPIVATTATAAGQLLDGMLTRLAGEEVCLDLHVGGLLDAAILTEHGLSRRRNLQRMHRGPSAGTAASICASAGPEYG